MNTSPLYKQEICSTISLSCSMPLNWLLTFQKRAHPRVCALNTASRWFQRTSVLHALLKSLGVRQVSLKGAVLAGYLFSRLVPLRPWAWLKSFASIENIARNMSVTHGLMWIGFVSSQPVLDVWGWENREYVLCFWLSMFTRRLKGYCW